MKPSKKYASWLGPELRQLIDKRNATHRRYKRTGRAAVFDEFLRLSKEVYLRIDQERNSFFQKHLSDALDANKDMRRFTSTVPARGARAPNRAISNSCLGY